MSEYDRWKQQAPEDEADERERAVRARHPAREFFEPDTNTETLQEEDE